MHNRPWRLLIGLGLLVPGLGSAAPALPQQWSAGDEGHALRGVVTLVWGDGPPTDPVALGPMAILTDGSGRRCELLFEPEITKPLGGVLALNHRRVVASGSRVSAPDSRLAETAIRVDRLELDEASAPAAPAAVTGSQPWVSILCKFADVPSEPNPLSYFQNMYGGTAPQLGHYWREVSYGHIDLAGSAAHGWYTLPQPRSYYISPEGWVYLTLLFNDCTAAADPDVYFPAYVGINFMFNDTIGCCAWGGSGYTTLDGVLGFWRTTYEPPWGFQNVSVMGHEMGHGFSLHHSGFVGDYDSAWDVMSNTWLCNPPDAAFGCKPQHPISPHKLWLGWLGWFPGPEWLSIDRGDSATVLLDNLALSEWPTTKMIFIRNPGTGPSYTVESRRRVGSYDIQLPGDAVIIHKVNGSAKVVGTDGGAGAMFTPGELFRDEANDIGVGVLSSTPEGALVSVANGSTLAASFPSVDTVSGQGTSSNLNGIFEPGETVQFGSAWANVSSGSVTATGSVSDFWGLDGATYTILHDQADFGTILPVTVSGCQSQGNCYVLRVTGGERPATHWDALLKETLSTGATKSWSLHLGNSFSDVPTTHWAYPAIESLLHSRITAGCGSGLYCPNSPVTRWQMAVFLARGLVGSDSSVPGSGSVPGLGSYDCYSGGTSVFADVPPTDSACRHVHYIASRGITSGCGGGNFCPGATLNRWQMAMFLAKAMAGTEVPTSGLVPGKGQYNCVSGGSSVFADVLPTDPACKEVHFLAAKQVTVGCGGGNFCPTATLPRSQIAAFLTRAFRLTLYQP